LPIRIRKLWISRINKMQLQQSEDEEIHKKSNSNKTHKQPVQQPVYKNL